MFMGTRPPNIVIFMPDEQRADCAGFMGNNVIQTPVLDKFANDHSGFSNFFVNNPVCTPSRIAMFTGWYPHVRGHRTLWNLLRPDEPNLFRYLKEGGYHVEAWGKNHLLSEESISDSVDHWGTIEFDRTRIPTNRWTKDDKWYNTFYFGERPAEMSTNTADADTLRIEGALNFLRSTPSEPFCLYIPLLFPHSPYWVEEPYFSLHNRKAVPPPLPANHEGKPKYYSDIHQSYGIDKLSEDDLRELRATYYGMCSRVDDQFGELINTLHEEHLWDNTAIFYLSDHGAYDGDYGLVEKWPSGFEDCLIRSPLAIRVPGIDAQPTNNTLCQTIDLTPTILDIAGIKLKHDQYGQSLLPLIKGDLDTLRDAVYCEGGHNRHEVQAFELKQTAPSDDYYAYEKFRIQTENRNSVCKSSMIRTIDWKYIHRTHDTDELYHLSSDPGEQTNLIDRPKHHRIQQELSQRLLSWFVETSDVVPSDRDSHNPEAASIDSYTTENQPNE